MPHPSDYESLLGIARMPLGERNEDRVPAEDEATIYVTNSDHLLEVHARLVDISPHGLRVMHRYPGMPVGREIRVLHPAGTQKAIVIWNRKVEGGYESGMRIVGE
ncbi:MAG TPA: PilZ domain-containing protein [Terriglobales bacterium]|nr:PilZ domain-containing protein [Terriglobales bacterium]